MYRYSHIISGLFHKLGQNIPVSLGIITNRYLKLRFHIIFPFLSLFPIPILSPPDGAERTDRPLHKRYLYVHQNL